MNNTNKAMHVGAWINQFEAEKLEKLRTKYDNMSTSDIVRLGMWFVFNELTPDETIPSKQVINTITKAVITQLEDRNEIKACP